MNLLEQRIIRLRETYWNDLFVSEFILEMYFTLYHIDDEKYILRRPTVVISTFRNRLAPRTLNQKICCPLVDETIETDSSYDYLGQAFIQNNSNYGQLYFRVHSPSSC